MTPLYTLQTHLDVAMLIGDEASYSAWLSRGSVRPPYSHPHESKPNRGLVRVLEPAKAGILVSVRCAVLVRSPGPWCDWEMSYKTRAILVGDASSSHTLVPTLRSSTHGCLQPCVMSSNSRCLGVEKQDQMHSNQAPHKQQQQHTQCQNKQV